MFSFNMNAVLGVGSSELSDIPWVRRATDHSQLKVGLSDCYWVLGYPKINSVSFQPVLSSFDGSQPVFYDHPFLVGLLWDHQQEVITT